MTPQDQIAIRAADGARRQLELLHRRHSAQARYRLRQRRQRQAELDAQVEALRHLLQARLLDLRTSMRGHAPKADLIGKLDDILFLLDGPK